MVTDVKSKQLTWEKLIMNQRSNTDLALNTIKQSNLQLKPCTHNKVIQSLLPTISHFLYKQQEKKNSIFSKWPDALLRLFISLQ